MHYSVMQNKPVNFKVIEHMKNKIMLNINVPKYFTLDLPPKVKQQKPQEPEADLIMTTGE